MIELIEVHEPKKRVSKFERVVRKYEQAATPPPPKITLVERFIRWLYRL